MRKLLMLTTVAALHACGGAEVADPSGAAPSSRQNGMRPAPVLVAEVERQTFSEIIEAVGTARARESVVITGRVSGQIRRILFDEGSAVDAGVLLVTLDDDEDRAEVDAATAAWEQARGRHQRLESLADRNLASRDALDEQQQALRAARARLSLAQARLDQREIRAPFAGTIGLREVSPGALITPGTPIATLDDLSVMRAQFAVPETQARFLAPGNSITATAAAWPDHLFEGRVRTIGTRVREDSRTLTVQAEFSNPGNRLRPGMLMVMQAMADSREALFVPEGAITPQNGSQMVWRLREEGTVEQLNVITGSRVPGRVEVTAGLYAGDKVVVEGTTRLRPGRSVTIVDSGQHAGGT